MQSPMKDSWSWIFVALCLGAGITAFFTAMLVSAAIYGWKLTIWTNTLGEGWLEIALFITLTIFQFAAIALHWRKMNHPASAARPKEEH